MQEQFIKQYANHTGSIRETRRVKIREKHGRQTAVKTDITTQQLTKQLIALSWPTYEFGIKSQQAQSMIRRTWTLDTVLDSVNWLKRANLNCSHIYLRPNDQNPYVLLDDISPAGLYHLKVDGIIPACVVSTSKMNFQAWIKVGSDPLENSLKTTIGGLLAKRYGGDQGSKDWRHLGRAVGFTNVKPKHQRADGLYPYVTLVSHSGVITPHYQQLITEARNFAAENTRGKADEAGKRVRIKHGRVENSRVKHRARRSPQLDPDVAFQCGVTYVHQKYGSDTDPSRADACSALWMYTQGFEFDEIEGAIANNADVQQRKRGHIADYARRTVSYAKRATLS